jgi:hypothetical protein
MLSRIMHLKVIKGVRTRASTKLDDAELITEQGFWDCDETCPHIVIRNGSVTQHRTDIAGQSSRFSHRRVLVTVRIL